MQNIGGKKVKKKILIEILISIILINFIFSSKVFSNVDAPKLYFSASSDTIEEGEEVEIAISGENICGTSFIVNYDSLFTNSHTVFIFFSSLRYRTEDTS